MIPPDTIQIGIMKENTLDDCMKPEWYDMICFFKVRQPVSEDFVEGFANLRYSHQMQIRYNLGFDINCYINGLLTTEQENQIKIQNNEYFEIFDKLKVFEGRDDLLDILTTNNQYVPESFIGALNHVCDIICFGALTPCSICKEGKFVLRNSGYCCTGYDSEWSSCINTVKEPQRIPVILPEKYQEIFGTGFEVRTRILRNVTEFNPNDFDMYTKQPLFGMEFVIIGDTILPREDVINRIQAMGGKIVVEIHENLAAVISNADEVDADTEMMQHAFTYQIQVIPDDFLNEAMNSDPIEVIVKKDLSKWGRDGTAIENFVSILTNGLKAFLPAVLMGSRYTRGIYFSDSISKSYAYCRATNSFGLVLLCEVVAGIMDIRYQSNPMRLDRICESVLALGKYYPHPVHIQSDGLKIPNGKLVRRDDGRCNLQFNEFIVFDECRVKIRYLVKWKYKDLSDCRLF